MSPHPKADRLRVCQVPGYFPGPQHVLVGQLWARAQPPRAGPAPTLAPPVAVRGAPPRSRPVLFCLTSSLARRLLWFSGGCWWRLHRQGGHQRSECGGGHEGGAGGECRPLGSRVAGQGSVARSQEGMGGGGGGACRRGGRVRRVAGPRNLGAAAGGPGSAHFCCSVAATLVQPAPVPFLTCALHLLARSPWAAPPAAASRWSRLCCAGWRASACCAARRSAAGRRIPVRRLGGWSGELCALTSVLHTAGIAGPQLRQRGAARPGMCSDELPRCPALRCH